MTTKYSGGSPFFHPPEKYSGHSIKRRAKRFVFKIARAFPMPTQAEKRKDG